MKKLIIINGPPASGKSTTLALLRPKLKNYVFVDRAYIKQMLKPLSKKLRKELSSHVSRFLITEAMKQKKNILTQEMCFDFFLKDALKYEYKIHEFSLYCTFLTALKRDKERSGKAKVGTIRKIHKKFRDKQPVASLVINTEENSPEKILKIMLKEIRKTYKER
jgi:cytidylate kinase